MPVTNLTRKVAGEIVAMLVDAGFSPWSSTQFGIVDRDKLQWICELVLNKYEITPVIPQWLKDKRQGKPDAFTK